MRLPRECYQMQQVIETHLPHLSQPQLTGLVSVGLRGYPRWQCLPERRRLGPFRQGQTGTACASISGEWLYDGSDRAKSLPDRTGRKSLLRAAPPVGPGLVAFRPPGPGRGPHLERGPDHRHRRQRGLPGLAPFPWPGASAGPPSAAPGWIPRWNCFRNWPSSSTRNDRDSAVRPGQSQSEVVETDTRSRVASLHEVSEKHHFLCPGRPQAAGRAFVPRPDTAGSVGYRFPPPPPNAVAPCWRSGTPGRRSRGS